MKNHSSWYIVISLELEQNSFYDSEVSSAPNSSEVLVKNVSSTSNCLFTWMFVKNDKYIKKDWLGQSNSVKFILLQA